MLQRQPRVGDIIDDYCPRERRVTDHAVVAMVEAEVRQTRCTTCDTEHEYRQAKVPPSRKKVASPHPPKPPAAVAASGPRLPEPSIDAAPADLGDAGPTRPPAAEETSRSQDDTSGGPHAGRPIAEGSVHRRLIRAVLPRIEGEVPTRQAPEFTMHRVAPRPGGHARPPRAAHGGKAASGHARHSTRPGGTNFGQRGPRGSHGGHGAHGSHAGPPGHGKGRHGRPHGDGQGRRRKH